MSGHLEMVGLTVYATEDHVLHLEWLDPSSSLEVCSLLNLKDTTARFCFHVDGQPKPCATESPPMPGHPPECICTRCEETT